MNLMDIVKADGSFTAWQPGVELDIEKAADSSPYLARIRGYCSTERRDRQDEVLLQRGLDFGDFVQFGFFNDNHAQETGAQIGVPELAEHHPGKGWYTEGWLLKSPRAQRVYELAKALAGTKRKLGFSVEGKIEKREGSVVHKAKIRHVAITHCPVNPDCTWDIVAKALTAGGTGAGSANGASIWTNGDTDLEKDVADHSCGIDGCRAVRRSAASLAKHKKDVHGVDPTEQESSRITRKSLVEGYTRQDAARFIRAMRPNWSEEMIRMALSRR